MERHTHHRQSRPLAHQLLARNTTRAKPRRHNARINKSPLTCSISHYEPVGDTVVPSLSVSLIVPSAVMVAWSTRAFQAWSEYSSGGWVAR